MLLPGRKTGFMNCLHRKSLALDVNSYDNAYRIAVSSVFQWIHSQYSILHLNLSFNIMIYSKTFDFSNKYSIKIIFTKFKHDIG